MTDQPTYQGWEVPPHLLTGKQLRARGYQLDDQRTPDAYVLVELFDVNTSGEPDPGKAPAYRYDDLRKVHSNSHKRWTADEDQRLAFRVDEGATVEQLMSEFGRNENAITSRIAKLDMEDSGATTPL